MASLEDLKNVLRETLE